MFGDVQVVWTLVALLKHSAVQELAWGLSFLLSIGDPWLDYLPSTVLFKVAGAGITIKIYS